MAKFTQIPTDTFETLQLNAGVICGTFDPESGDVSDIIAATSGGSTFSDTINFKDMGEGIDNCPLNTKELKRIDNRVVTLSGTAKTFDKESMKFNMAAADITANKIVPRDDLKLEDFKDIWWVGDYGDEEGGFIAIKLMNTLSTGGFQIKSNDKDTGESAYEYTAHYSVEDISKVPY